MKSFLVGSGGAPNRKGGANILWCSNVLVIFVTWPLVVAASPPRRPVRVVEIVNRRVNKKCHGRAHCSHSCRHGRGCCGYYFIVPMLLVMLGFRPHNPSVGGNLTS